MPNSKSKLTTTLKQIGDIQINDWDFMSLLNKDIGELHVTEEAADGDTRRQLHRTIAAVRDDMAKLEFNTAIAALMELNNHLTRVVQQKRSAPREVVRAMVLMLAPLMIPYQALLIPIYLNFSTIGLANSHLGLAIVHAVLQLPFSIYLMRNAFEAIPREIEEAALIDGATSLQVLRRIFLPLVMPGVVTVMLFTFINSWNEFLAALIFMNKESSFTVPIMLVSVRTGRLGAVDWGALQAGVIVSVLPCILIYVLLQKYYVSGFLSGAVK